MTSSKRRRELARAKAERQASRRQESSQRRRRRNQITAVLAVLVVVGGGIAWYVASRPAEAPIDAAVPTESPAPTDAPAPTDSPAPSDSAAPTDAPSPTDSTGPQPDSVCQEAPPARPDNMSWDAAPAEALEPGKDYTLTLATNCGDIVIATEPQTAPITVNSMVFLANQGYFNLTACHRLTTEGIFVLQCGDPAGNGTGGPGYSIPDENLPPEGTANYPAGTVAMANAGPGTGGSQFFIVYEDTTLPSGYTIWGRVAEGLDVVRGIAAAGVEGGGSDGAPAQKVTIITAEVTPA